LKSTCFKELNCYKNYNVTLKADLIKSLKILAVENDVRANDLLGEAIQDFLKKYGNES
jgi:hypothetical protein